MQALLVPPHGVLSSSNPWRDKMLKTNEKLQDLLAMFGGYLTNIVTNNIAGIFHIDHSGDILLHNLQQTN